MFGSKKRKARREQFDRDIWGEAMSAPKREPGILKFEEKTDSMPQDQRNRRYLTLTIAIIVAFAACLIAGTLYTCTDHAPERATTASSTTASSASSTSTSSSSSSLTATQKRFLNTDAYKDLMSDETLAKFEEQTLEYLKGQGGTDKDYVMCYSRIDHKDGNYTTYISSPDDTKFYKVTFDVAKTSFSFEPLSAMPEGLPEINYDALEKAKAATGVSVDDASASSSASTSSSTTIYYNLTDTASLKTFMPDAAANTLASSVTEYCQTKGRPIATNQSLVIASTITNTSNGVSMDVDCAQEDGSRFTVNAEWFNDRNQFGMAIK